MKSSENEVLKNAIKDYKKSIVKKSCCGSFVDFINDSQIFGIICAAVQFVLLYCIVIVLFQKENYSFFPLASKFK